MGYETAFAATDLLKSSTCLKAPVAHVAPQCWTMHHSSCQKSRTGFNEMPAADLCVTKNSPCTRSHPPVTPTAKSTAVSAPRPTTQPESPGPPRSDPGPHYRPWSRHVAADRHRESAADRGCRQGRTRCPTISSAAVRYSPGVIATLRLRPGTTHERHRRYRCQQREDQPHIAQRRATRHLGQQQQDRHRGSAEQLSASMRSAPVGPRNTRHMPAPRFSNRNNANAA